MPFQTLAAGCSDEGLLHIDFFCMTPNVGWNKGLSWAAPVQIVATVPLVRPMVGWNGVGLRPSLHINSIS